MPTGIPGNAATLAVGKQTAKGTPQATPTYKLRYSGGFGPAPAIQEIELAESDASALASQSVRVGARVEGTSSHYVRPDEMGLLALLLLGANADSGTTPNYTHTSTFVTNTGPYATLYKAYNSTTLVDQYVDCKLSQGVFNGATGGALTCDLTWGGLSATLGSTDPVLAPSAQAPLAYPQVVCTIGGSAPGTVQSFTLTVNRNANFFQADTGMASTDYIMGRSVVTGSLTILFESDAKYRAFYTGATSGTALSSAIFGESLTILAQVNANLSVSFVMNTIQYSNVTVNMNTDGSPATMGLDFRSANLGTVGQFLSIITKNAVASY